ncbi:hypothetical protein FB451DRAFT_1362774 [Mycena latifolia]|nr:hypothetical protein FB451DRAFT_1362774 [Mycena latifolia]
MSRQSTVAESRANNIVTGLKAAATLFSDLHDAFGTPCVLAIANTTQSLISGVQNIKKNKEECIQLLEDVYEIIYAVVNLHINSATPGSLPPATLIEIGKFKETLHTIHTFVEAQQGGNKIKHFFKQTEMAMLLKDCRRGLQDNLDVFKINSGATLFNNIREMQKKAERTHNELLDLISMTSNTITSDGASSMNLTLNESNISSRSFSMLPGRPKIFHGRESELAQIVRILCEPSPRIAILGTGGMGKTSLARAALHHPDVAAKYQHRFFIPGDLASTGPELAALIGSHLGLKPAKNFKPVLRFLAGITTCLLILDNLETAWEPLESRSRVEEVLSLLTDIPHLALMVTMRGAERPAKVRWTRPFLQPLQPLSDDAARQTFVDIADDLHDTKEMEQIIRLTDNMPLAVDLIAQLVDHEGCSNVLARWEMERTSVLSDGHDRRSSLDLSISMSLQSPRMTTLPGAKDLLSLLSILPDGLSDIELLQCNLPIQDVLGCKAALLGTSLAYSDDRRRVKSLVPIREYMQHHHPAALSLVWPLQEHFHILIELYRQHRGSPQTGRINQIALNYGNLNQILLRGLLPENPNLEATIRCTISLNIFSRLTGHGRLKLMDHIPSLLAQYLNEGLEMEFITTTIFAQNDHLVLNRELLVSRAIHYLNHVKDPNPVREATIYRALAHHYAREETKIPEALKFFEKALLIAKSSGHTVTQAALYTELAQLNWRIGKHTLGQTLAIEAQKAARLSGNLYEEARALRMEATCCRELGDYRNSITLLHRAGELVGLCGMTGGNLDHGIMTSEAEVHRLKSEYSEARYIHSRIAQNTSADEDLITHAFALLNIAELDVVLGATEHSIDEHLQKAKMLFTKVNAPDGIHYCEAVMADFKLLEGNTSIARTMFGKCLRWSLTHDTQLLSFCLERIADVTHWAVTDFHWTSSHVFIYLAHAKMAKEKLPLYKALKFLGALFLFNQDEVTAKNLFNVALEGFTFMDVHRSRADCMLCLGDIAKNQGQSDRAAAFWKDARSLFARSLQENSIAQVDHRLAIWEQERK